MRISDWSSDVCSSDLDLPGRLRQANGSHGRRERTEAAGQPLRRPLGVAALAFQAVQAARRGDDAGGIDLNARAGKIIGHRSEEHTSELQSLMRISYAVFCLKKQRTTISHTLHTTHFYIHTEHKAR